MFSNYIGLKKQEVEKLQNSVGPNLLPHTPPPTRLQVFISQLKNPFIYVLLGATIITVLIGHSNDAIIIMIAVMINTILGYVQEYKANNSLSALTNYLTSQVKVIREGKLTFIQTEELVPGDIAILDSGSRIPADGVVLEANRASVNEALLTGESLPLSKHKDASLYMGTILESGQIVMQITQIGANTKMGSIASKISTKTPPTPLERQLNKLSKQILIIISILLAFVFVLGIARRLPIEEIFVTSVSLAVSSIPEGLVISLTIILAIGMQKIMRYKGLVRRLTSAETLGGVTVICLDKTGTLTTGELSVVQTTGNQVNLATQIVASSDHDDPLVIAAHHWAKSKVKESSDYVRLDTLPFESKCRFGATLHSGKSKNLLYISGAPETIIDACKMDHQSRLKLQKQLDLWAQKGHRLVAYASLPLPASQTTIADDFKPNNLHLTGVIAFNDTVRLSVAPALAQAELGGVRTMVITGDYSLTAQKVLSFLNISLTSDEIMLGDDFAHLSYSDRARVVSQIKLFARTTPEQKLLIVESLKNNHEVVAMMGDGVNDAPALHMADIGVVVGSATDVAKETADLILLDSNFDTVIHAIREGRAMFDNLRKIILYLMCDAFAEIMIVIASIALNYPLPLVAAQILWINIVSDGFPSLALTVDPSRRDIMHTPPRAMDEPLLSKWMIHLIVLVSSLAAIFAFGAFLIAYHYSQDPVFARSVTFLTLGLNSLAYVFSVRLLTTSFWRDNLFANRYLIGAVLLAFILQIIPFITSPLHSIFGIVPLNPSIYLSAFGLSIMLFFVVEIFKIFLSHHPHRK